jgi:hypothetical protein
MNLFKFGPRTILAQRKFFLPNKTKAIINNCPVAQSKSFFSSGEIHYSKVYEMMTRLTPPVGFGKKCPKMVAYKVR